MTEPAARPGSARGHDNGGPPPGLEHEVGLDDLLFSTTDADGIIEHANAAFARISQHPHADLVGAPHGLTRHPDMPWGAFRLLWDQVQSGRPACAYLKEVAGDGGAYWVFATVVPVGDRNLIVGKRPQITSLRTISRDSYTAARAAESRARADGADLDAAARIGLDLLGDRLGEAGIRDADDLLLTALPLEMSAHRAASTGLPRRPDATGPAADLLTAVHAVDAQTATLTACLDEYADLVVDLERSRRDTGPVLARVQALAAAARGGLAAGHGQTPDILESFTRGMTDNAAEAELLMTELRERLGRLAAHLRWLRMRIALLRLHNLMMGAFAGELIDGTATPDAAASMDLLGEALADGGEELGIAMSTVTTAMAAVPPGVEDTVRRIDKVGRLAAKWRSEVVDTPLGTTLATQLHLLAPVAGTEEAQALRRFYAVAARCALMTPTCDRESLLAAIAAVHDAVRRLGAG